MIVLLVILGATVVPLSALAHFYRIYPNGLLVAAVVLPVLATVPLMFLPGMFWVVVGTDVLLGAVALIDLASVPKQGSFSVERELGRIASLRKKHSVTLTLTNHSVREFLLRVRDGLPPELRPQREQFKVRLGPRSRLTLQYELEAKRRGAFELRDVYVLITSRWHLWKRYLDYPAVSELHVYPDMKQLGEYAVLARTNRLALMGVRRVRRIGQDNEFERLRDYTQDDNYKHIDWRATSRRQKLIVRDFQRNQSQTLLFLIDCGRMMTNQAAGLSLLDHALNSMLMLSYVALSHGDAVGMISFSDVIHGFVPPKSGLSQMNRLLHASFNRFPELVESRYDEAFLYLKTHCRKRSLVIFITNIIDEVNSNQVERYLGTMVGRHLPMAVFLRDRQLFAAAEVPHPQGSALFRAAAAAEILTWRHQVLRDLTSKGVLSVDVFPEDLTAPLVNRYLEIKARHLL